MAHTDDTPPGRVTESTFPATEGPVSRRVVEAVASIRDADPTDLEPLYRTIDTDAINALYSGPDNDRTPELSFQYEGVAIHIHSDATIQVSESN